jgi:hypothetical protein
MKNRVLTIEEYWGEAIGAAIACFGGNIECADVDPGFGGSAGRSLPRATRPGDEDDARLVPCKDDADGDGDGTAVVFGLA